MPNKKQKAKKVLPDWINMPEAISLLAFHVAELTKSVNDLTAAVAESKPRDDFATFRRSLEQ